MALHEEKRKLVRRMNSEMRAIASSRTAEVMRHRKGLLAALGGELKALNDRIAKQSCRLGRVS